MPSAAILAGGRATRYGGQNKSALRLGGRSILERQLFELTEVADDLLLVGGTHPDAPPGLRRIPDRMPDQGPLGGLDAALAAARHPVLVLVACDMPFVTAALLRHLAASAAGVDAVVPRTERGYHPLCAVYTRACQPAVGAHLHAGRRRMTDLLGALRVSVVEGRELEAFGDSRRLLANVNTPETYAAIDAGIGHEL